MRQLLLYIDILFLIVVALPSCRLQQKPGKQEFKETFSKDDKNPFGSYAPYNHFRQVFADQPIKINSRPFAEVWKSIKDHPANGHSLYVVVAKNFVLTNDDTQAFLNYVTGGNDLFIAADYIDEDLLMQVNCSEERRSEVVVEASGVMRSTKVSIPQSPGDSAAAFRYFYYPFLNFFYNFDPVQSRVLGVNESGEPDYVVLFLGSGRLYLHAAPRAFSNYFFLTHDNYQYLENILSYLRPEPVNIFWDEYYKNRRINDQKRSPAYSRNNSNSDRGPAFSSLVLIQKSATLSYAFWLAITTIILYILFRVKRKQRIIAGLSQNANTTLAFTETVGRLYLQKKDNKKIAEKMITYFHERTRNKFYLNTTASSEELKISLSRKTGLDMEDIKKLFDGIAAARSADIVTDDEILSLNNLMEKINLKRKDGKQIV